MRITFVLPNLSSGGAERVCVNYIRQLACKNYVVSLVIFKKTTELLPLIPDNVSVIDLDSGPTRKSFWPLLKALRYLKPDVVFTTHSRTATLLMSIKPFLRKFRHLARMQSTPSLEQKYSAYGSLNRKLYALGFRSADVVIAQTEAMKEDGVKLFKLDHARVSVLPNPIDAELIYDSLKGLTSPFKSNEIAAVASGRLSFEKGFDVLISALPAVVKKAPNFVLYILGNDNGDGEKLRKLVSGLGLESNVRFLGFQSNPYRYYAFCDLYVLSSRWEGFPNALLENYLLNTPIASTSCVPVVKQLVNEGVNGFICEPDNVDALSSVILRGICLGRAQISNPSYTGSTLDEFL